MGADTEAKADEDKEKHESFKVFARVRPAKEHSKSIRVVTRFDKSHIIQCRNLEFVLDWVWDINDTQEMVYNRGVRERVGLVLQGFNATVMMYGQTGSGKTHTMFGPDEVLDPHKFEHSDPALHGVVPRACTQLFETMANANAEVTYVVHVSYVECYNGNLRDVLATGKRDAVVARESANGLQLEGLSHTLVSSPAEVMRTVMRGNANRVVAAMKMNDRSSRGHAVITLHVREVRGEGSERAGKLSLVDLAGMESSKKSYAMEGASKAAERQEEVKHINQSLWALGSVIERLSALGGKEGHVPYRDSKLTRLLQSSLTGSSKCAFIATLRGEEENLDESIGTLRFAQRAKAIKVKVSGNNETMNRAALQNALNKAREELRKAHATIEEMEAAMANAAADAEAKAAAAAAAAAAHSQAHAESLARTCESPRKAAGGGGATGGDGSGGGGDSGESEVHLRKAVQEYEGRLSAMAAELAAEQQAVARSAHQAMLNTSLLTKKTAEVETLGYKLEEAAQNALELEESLAQRDTALQDKEDELLAMRAMLASGGASRRGGGGGGGSEARRSSIAHGVRLDTQGSIGAFSFESGDASAGGGLGGGLGGLDPISESNPSMDVELFGGSDVSTREQQYDRFVALANARKLALAARGFEVENVFVDQLFDDAERAGVPEDKWLEFLKDQFAAPEESEEGDEEEVEGGEPSEGEEGAEGPEGVEGAEGDSGHRPASAAGAARWKKLRRVSHAMHAWSEAGRRGVARRVELFPDRGSPTPDAGISAEELDAEMWSRLGGAEREASQRASASPGRLRRLVSWARSEDGFRLVLASITLVLLCVLRLRRLSPEDPLAMWLNDMTGRWAPPPLDPSNQSTLVQAGDEDFLAASIACRYDWTVSACVERAAGTLAEGVFCAFKPRLINWLRCRPAAAPLTPSRASCPAHCRTPAQSCTASAASVLLRVAQTLRDETGTDTSKGLLPPGRA